MGFTIQKGQHRKWSDYCISQETFIVSNYNPYTGEVWIKYDNNPEEEIKINNSGFLWYSYVIDENYKEVLDV